jgi:arginyl-tRNA synthetase
MHQISDALKSAAKALFNQDISVELTRPDEQFGDLATNVALQLAGRVGKKPREVAEQLVAAIKNELGDTVKGVSIAGPGFINLTLSDAALLERAKLAPATKPTAYKGKVVVAEYGDPNPFKILHAGHLYTDVVGDAVANLMEVSGGEVHRVNCGGDVGLHVGRAMWAIR